MRSNIFLPFFDGNSTGQVHHTVKLIYLILIDININPKSGADEGVF